MKRNRIGPGVWTAVILALLAVLWQVAVDRAWIQAFFFSSPRLVWQELGEMVSSGLLWRHLSVTLKEAGLGLLLGGLLGTGTGLFLGTHPRVSRALTPLMTGLNGLPKLALGPLIIIWFGLGLKSKVLISALMVFFVFAFNLFAGVRGTDRSLITAARLLGATRGQVLRTVLWPASIPWLLASLRTGIGLSLTGAVVGEYLGAGKGLGWLISNAGESYDVDQVMACILVILVLVMVLDGLLRLAETRLLRWQ